MHYEILPNGTEVLLAADHRAPSTALQVWVRVGSLHEGKEQHGMAHFIEHMLFKGTANSKVGELWQRIASWGGDINAHTDYDHTVYHLTVNAAYTLDSIAALHDAIYHSELVEREIAREKEVVCEEINHYQDDPSDRLYEEARRLAFQGQVHPILGDSNDSVCNFSRKQLLHFYRTHYVPRNMTVTAVGAFEINAVREKIAQLFGNEPDKGLPPVDVTPLPFTQGIQTSVLRGDYHTHRLLFAMPAPCQQDIDSLALDFAAFALGSGDASRLNQHIRDKHEHAAAISCTNTSYSRWGMFEIAALTDSDNITALIARTTKLLQRMLQREPLKAEEVARAKANAKADFALQNESAAGLADNLAHGLTTPWKYLFNACYFDMLERITPDLAQRALSRWLNFARAVIVCVAPEDSQLEAADLATTFKHVLVNKASRPITSPRRRSTSRARRVLQLREGIQVIHQPTQSELFNLIAVTRGGLAFENQHDNGTHNALALLLGQANPTHSRKQLAIKIEGCGAALSGFSDTDCIGLGLQCLKRDAVRLSKIFASCLLQPRFPAARWHTLVEVIESSIALQEEDSFAFCMQKYREAMFVEHPYSLPPQGTQPEAFDSDVLLADWQRHYLQRGKWVFAVSTTLEAERFSALLQEALVDFNPPASSPTMQAVPDLRAECEGFYEKEREQCHIVYGLRGLTWRDAQRATLDVWLKLKAHRLFITLREEQGLVYTVAPVLTYAVGAGTFGLYTACAPDKAERAQAALVAELQHGKPPRAEEITRAQQFLAGTWHTEMAHGYRQVMHTARMQLFGVGHRHLENYPQRVQQVTAADIAALSERLLHNRPHVCVKVGLRV